MKRRYSSLLVFCILVLTLSACIPASDGLEAPTPSQDDVLTAVALTFEAMIPPATETLTPEPSLLPHSLYYLGRDAAGLAQVFRMEADGKAIIQVTNEPVEVRDFGVAPVDGSVAYVVNNQLMLINADGSEPRMLVDGGPVDENNPFLNRISHPVFSPDAGTIAFGHQGLNFYELSTGETTRVIENQVDDLGNGAFFPKELYWPEDYSPDGSRLLITLGYYEGASAAFYDLASKELVRLQGDQDATICCDLTQWSYDGKLLHSASPSMGMSRAGLWAVDPLTGVVVPLLTSDWDTLTINHAKHAYLAPDDRLYYFFHTSNNPDLGRIPVQLVRSEPDGVTGRTLVLDETFEMMNEALWAPDAEFVIVVNAEADNVYQGGQAQIVYLDGRPKVALTPFVQQLEWGPS